jgi:hypothetical protein
MTTECVGAEFVCLSTLFPPLLVFIQRYHRLHAHDLGIMPVPLAAVSRAPSHDVCGSSCGPGGGVRLVRRPAHSNLSRSAVPPLDGRALAESVEGDRIPHVRSCTSCVVALPVWLHVRELLPLDGASPGSRGLGGAGGGGLAIMDMSWPGVIIPTAPGHSAIGRLGHRASHPLHPQSSRNSGGERRLWVEPMGWAGPGPTATPAQSVILGKLCSKRIPVDQLAG